MKIFNKLSLEEKYWKLDKVVMSLMYTFLNGTILILLFIGFLCSFAGMFSFLWAWARVSSIFLIFFVVVSIGTTMICERIKLGYILPLLERARLQEEHGARV